MKTISMEQARRVAGGQSVTVSAGGDGGGSGVVTMAAGTAAAAGIFGGVGAARAIEAAGSLGAMGNGAIAANAALGTGYVTSFGVGYWVGTQLYNGSEMVREVAQGTVANVMENGLIGAFTQGISAIITDIFGGGGGAGGRRPDGDPPVAAH